MFTPPNSFKNLKALLWAAPLWTFMAVVGVSWAWGQNLTTSVVAGSLCAILSTFGAAVAIWHSRFGSRHGLTVVIAVFFIFCIPLGTVLVGAMVSAEKVFRVSLAVILLDLIFLALAAFYYGRRSVPIPFDKPKLFWDELSINLKKQTWRQSDSPEIPERTFGAGPWAIGFGSVVIHGIMIHHLTGDQRVVFGLMLGKVVNAYLVSFPLGRALARSIKVVRLERAIGVSLQHDAISRLRNQTS